MSFRLTVPTAALGDAFFDDMPPEVRDFLGAGFAQLATLPPETLSGIADHIVEWLDPSGPAPEIKSLADEFNVAVPSMNALVSACTLQASALYAPTRRTPADRFVTKMTSAGILKKECVDAMQAFGVEHLRPRRVALSDALARAHSSTHIVPSFASLDTTIDLRVAAIHDDRVVTLPIVIATLRTDVDDKEVLFQMTPRDVGKLRQQLEAITKRLARSKGMTTQPTSEK